MRRLIVCLFFGVVASWANFQTAVGTFTQGTTSIDVGFAPKAVLFFPTRNTATGSQANAAGGIGACDGTGQWAEWAGSLDAQDTSLAKRASSSTKAILIYIDSPQTKVAEATCAFAGNTIALSWGTDDLTDRLIGYVALGGSDIINAKAGTFTCGASEPQQVIGVGFQPDALIFGFATGSATAGGANEMLSFVTASASHSVSAVSGDVLTTSNTARYQRALAVAMLSVNGGSWNVGSLSSMDADGFTLSFSQRQGGQLTGYLALKGGSYAVGQLNQPTSNGTQKISGLSFAPSVALFASNNYTTNVNVQSHGRLSIGAATSTARFSYWHGDQDNVDVTLAHSDLDTTKVIKMMTEAGGGSPATNASATVSSWDAGGITLNWGGTDATAREYGYMLFGPAAAGSTTMRRRVVVIQ